MDSALIQGWVDVMGGQGADESKEQFKSSAMGPEWGEKTI